MANIVYESGAKRSDMKPRYRDIPLALLTRIGKAFSEGAEKYERDLPPHKKNWTQGDLYFACDVLDHAIEHLYAYKETILDRMNGYSETDNEDHLGHLGANLGMLAQFEAWGYFDPEDVNVWVQKKSVEVETQPGPDTVQAETDNAVPVDLKTNVLTTTLKKIGLLPS